MSQEKRACRKPGRCRAGTSARPGLKAGFQSAFIPRLESRGFLPRAARRHLRRMSGEPGAGSREPGAGSLELGAGISAALAEMTETQILRLAAEFMLRPTAGRNEF